MATSDDGRGRRALLIGVDRYPLLPAHQLQGCVNDVTAMAAVLRTRFGFPSERVTVLTDGDATQAGIRAALAALAGEVEPDDVVVLHYSGHGSQRSVDPARPDLAEGDRLDETIVPGDSGRGADPNRDITDDEVHAWLTAVTAVTPNVTLVFDCCHSGTVVRDLGFGLSARDVPADERPFETMGIPADDPSRTVAVTASGRGPSRWLPVGDRWVLLAACRAEEKALEHGEGDVVHGAFTAFLLQALEGGAAGATAADLFQRAAAVLTSRYPAQHPQMEGAGRDRELFGTRFFEAVPFVPVTERTGDAVSLEAGAVLGASAGSEWGVFPAGLRAADPALRVGRVRLDTVGPASSRGTMLEETTQGAVGPGTVASLEAAGPSDPRLAVEVVGVGDDPAVAAGVASVREVVDEARFGRAAGAAPTETAAAGGSDLRAYVLAPRSDAGADDPVPQLGAVDRPTLAVVGPDGRLAMPVTRLDAGDWAERLEANLGTLARYRASLAITNPAPPAGLAAVRFTLLRAAEGGAWVEAEPDPSTGIPTFSVGDAIGLRIANPSPADVFVTVLDFGLAGRIFQLHPPAGPGDRLVAGGQIDVPPSPDEGFALAFPDGFPFVADPGERAPADGIETFKLFATAQSPLDLGPLLGGGLRDLDGPAVEESGLGRLLGAALAGSVLRDVAPRAPTDQGWITVDRPFLLRATPG
jgi:hypothetical protein